MKKPLFAVVKAVSKPFIGTGIGRIEPIRKIYAEVTRRVVPNEARTVTMDEGFQLRVDTERRGLDGMAGTVINTRKYEPVTTAAVKKILKPGMTAVDVGACVGYYTMLFSKLVGDEGRVRAFEPEPSNYDILCENMKLNVAGNVVAHNVAASDKNELTDFYVSDSESGEHSLIKGRQARAKAIRVFTVRLDDILSERRVDLIKTDTEGNDRAVLEGAERIIGENPDIIVVTEFFPPVIKDTFEFWTFIWRRFPYIYIADETRKQVVFGAECEAVRRCANGKFSVNLICANRRLDIG